MNKDNTEMQKGISFLKLIEKKILIPKIQRDYAQGRLDRKTSEIRNNFLTSIFETLTTKNSDPLLLDFIYGSTHDNVFTPLDGQQRLTTLFLLHWYFIPESQKLLLFKEHGNSRYSLFSYETRISSKDFCNALVTQSSVKLKMELENYKVSLQEQIDQAESNLNEIINKIPAEHSEEKKQNLISQINNLKREKVLANFSTIIKNQSWFLWSWRKDPTIKAMLVMLDEIEDRDKHIGEETHNTIWKQLENGKIIFHRLPLEQFALSDELYVKMNARGKELSAFDIFKSTLEEQMHLNGIIEDTQNIWRNNIDSNWIDLFWNTLAKPYINDEVTIETQKEYVDKVEGGYLKFLKRMMEFHLFVNEMPLKIDDELDDDNIIKLLPQDFFVALNCEYSRENLILNLRDYSVRKEFKHFRYDILDLLPLFCKTNFFNNDFFKFTISSLRSLIYTVDNLKHDGTDLINGLNFENKSNSLFESFIADNIDYETRIQFFAIIKFFTFNSAQNVSENEELQIELNSWMRVIRNLSTNTNSYFYNGFDDFLKSLKAINEWSNSVYSNEGGHNIINYFKEQKTLDGFNRDQLIEEKIKAKLMGSDEWRAAIIKAEEHPYFLGQIRFLLEWSKVEENYDIKLFNKYKSHVLSIFDKDGLISDLTLNHVFRNVLMTVDDWYLLNDCFMQNTSKHRDWSWKRYLRDSEKSINIKKLIDQFQENNQLFKNFYIVRHPELPSDWRRFFIEKPEIYKDLYDDKISYWNRDAEEICLLSKTRWSSKHKELKTFYLYLKFKCNGDSYLDSTHENHPFSAVFKRNNNNEFSVKFIPKWDNKWVQGQYVVSSNYDSGFGEFQLNETNKRWEIYFNSTQFENVEKMINALNSK